MMVYKFEVDFENLQAADKPIFEKGDDEDANRSNLPLNRNIAFLPYALSETIIRVMNMDLLPDPLTTIQPQPPNQRHYKVVHGSHNMY